MTFNLPPEYADLKVIDSDSHIVEAKDLWTSRVPDKYKELVPHVVKNTEGKDVWLVNGDEVLGIGGVGSNIMADGSKHPLADLLNNGFPYEEIHPASYDPKERVKILDEVGIWAQVAYPNVTGFGAEKFQRVGDPELSKRIISIYNDAMAEFQSDTGDRVFPMALVPFWDVEAAAVEAARAIQELNLRGIAMCAEPHAAPGQPDLIDKHWDPLWEVCTDLSIPVNFHVGATEFGLEAFMKGVWPSHDKTNIMIVGASIIELHQARIIANMLMSDLFSRFPAIKWIMVESGIGYIPYLFERLGYQIADAQAAVDYVLPHPQKQFQEHMYACFWFEDFAPRYELEMVGFDNVLFETDFPHPTCLYPSAVEHGINVLQKWGPEVVRKVMSENAAGLYNIPI